MAVAFGPMRRGTHIAREAVGHSSGDPLGAATRGAERAASKLYFASTLAARQRHRLKVDGPSVGGGAIGARADAALDLHRLEAVSEIGEIREVDELILGIVERDPVEREIHTRVIDPTKPQIAVVRERARFRV